MKREERPPKVKGRPCRLAIGGMRMSAKSLMRVRGYFLPGSLRIAAAARAPAERYIAAAERKTVSNRPAANIAAGHSPASHNATTASQPTLRAMPVLGTVWQTAKESIDEYWRLTLNAASTRVALKQAIEGRSPHGRLNADSGTLRRSTESA
jgi:hypothetical protein